ncbi:MAG: RnfABCDGE type electron transport complex subunit D [bacterium]|nr:RnfABCDGE type electron transport complex subunit D [bacterium]
MASAGEFAPGTSGKDAQSVASAGGLIVSSAPHIRGRDNIRRMMYDVAIALIPAGVASVYFFGLRSLAIILITIAGALGAEALIQKIIGRRITITDGSALVTAVLLAYNLPPTVPFWLPFVGALIAIGLGKMVYGGLGYNPFNPALVSRAVLLSAWPVLMTRWVSPFDAVTTATPLAALKMGGNLQAVKDLLHVGSDLSLYGRLFYGSIGGCLGETSALALLLGGGYLMYRRVITWHMPVTYMLTVMVMAVVLRQDPVFHLLAGGLILGAVYMATCPVTTPVTPRGRIYFGLGAGLLTILIRTFGSLPEGVMYSILLMNAATPLIDRYTRPRIYGRRAR